MPATDYYVEPTGNCIEWGAIEAAKRAEPYVDGRDAWFSCEVEDCTDRARFVVKDAETGDWRAVCAATGEHMLSRHLDLHHGFGSGDIWPFDHLRRLDTRTGSCEDDCQTACAYPGQFAECDQP